MGLERVSSILLGKMSNYDIDVFTRIFTAIQKVAPGLRDYTGLVGEEDKDYVDIDSCCRDEGRQNHHHERRSHNCTVGLLTPEVCIILSPGGVVNRLPTH